MKALLIQPEAQQVSEFEVQSLDDIKSEIGFDTVTSDAVGDAGDRVFFDEECFLRQTCGRFQIDTLIPISGKAIVVGGSEDGQPTGDASLSSEDLLARVKFL